METLFILFALLTLLILRTPVAIALGALGVILLSLKGIPLVGVPQRLFGAMDSFELLAVPMFILMSNILLRGKVGHDLFNAIHSWVGHWPGGMGVATSLSCTLFSAISGSSVATAATIGTVAIPEMEKRGYQKSFVYGLLAAGGTLGILIPPSIPLIIYGVITETSIATLFLAGIGPGLLLSTLFAVYCVVHAKRHKHDGGSTKADWHTRWSSSLKATPTLLLMVLVIGSIYAGIATPSESAALGFIAALLITFGMGRMDWQKVKEATYASMNTTSKIFLIIAGAKVFSYAITLYLIPQKISISLANTFNEPGLLILGIAIVLLIIGLFLESLSMLLIMAPVLFPSILAAGIDPVWFGIFFVILIETALITPPVGMNLFVIQSVAKARLEEIIYGAWPFVLMLLGTLICMWFWKDLALFLSY